VDEARQRFAGPVRAVHDLDQVTIGMSPLP
jgi:hypothetical protein